MVNYIKWDSDYDEREWSLCEAILWQVW
jgi:hypothetical protein